MSLSRYVIYFLTGGVVTTLIVALEQSGKRTLSGLATLVPVFTLVAYVFIGETEGGAAVGQHAKWVLAGTLVSWVPYMLTVAYLAPKVGSHTAIALAMGVFFALALAYIAAAHHYRLFQ